jgi:hypothetical protein
MTTSRRQLEKADRRDVYAFPMNMNGSCTPRSRRVQRAFAIKVPNVPGQSRRPDRNEGEPNMSFKKLATSAAVIAGLLATSLSPLATAANAADRWHKNDHRSYSHHYDGPRHHHGPRHRYAYKRHHNHGKDVARGIAIGLGILAVGSILSSAHHR